jgi:DNA-binding response OmpR family regulator
VRTVLVVDDSVDILSALSEALRDEGWVVIGAVTVPAAMHAVKRHKIDVVLCDVLLDAGTDGMALRHQFIEQGSGHIPFTFMTASLREIASLKREGESVLRKPFAVSEVVRFLGAAIARHDTSAVAPRPSGAARRSP